MKRLAFCFAITLGTAGCAGSIPQSPILEGLGQGMQAGAQSYQPQRPVNCTSNVIGGTTFTNCY
jgi:hypothetical protein